MILFDVKKTAFENVVRRRSKELALDSLSFPKGARIGPNWRKINLNSFNLKSNMLNMKRFFTKSEEKSNKKEEFPEGLKWIYVSLVVYFEGTKKEILEIAEDITNIINNTHSVMDSKGHPAGHVNPYLGLGITSASKCENGRITNVHLLSYNSPKELVLLNLSRMCYPIKERVDKRWRLTFVPEKTNNKDKTNLYSIENLNHDLWMLAGASNLICEKYGVIIDKDQHIIQ